MKKIRMLSLVLAILMLTGTVMLLSSCKKEKDGVVTLSRKTVELDLGEYAMVYGDSQSDADYTATFRSAITAMADRLSAVTGMKVSPSAMARAKTGAADKEILIGLTTREESRTAHAELEGDGFVIRVTENKLVLVGSSNLFTLMALNYFVEKYLTDAEPGKPLAVHENALASKVGTLTLAGNGEATYTYVHKDGLATLSDSSGKMSKYQEYPQAAIDEIVAKMIAQTGLKEKLFPIKTDAESFEKEVRVGLLGREGGNALLADVAENEYLIAADGENVVVTAWSETALRSATTAYADLLQEGTVKAADGSVSVQLPRSFRMKAVVNNAWVLDFPRPEGEGIKLYNTVDNGSNGLQFLYLGDGVNATAYKAYCDTLKAAGYTVYTESTAEGSIFTTFVNKDAGVMLHTAYNDYAHAAEYAEKYSWVASKVQTGDEDAYDFQKAIRIVSAPLTDAYLVPQNLLSKQTYTKVTDTKITTTPIYGKAVGLCYIITLEDGSFVVFDGGGVGGENSLGNEHGRLWETLVALHTEVYGVAPSASNRLRIAAWVLTHSHWDHYYAFEQMVEKYGNLMEIDYMIGNMPAENAIHSIGTPSVNLKYIEELKKSVKGGFEYIKVHTGQHFNLVNLGIEVLCTWEDLNPLMPNDFNDTDTVLRFTYYNQDAPSAKPITGIWTGDAARRESRFMCATYGPYLESDMVSVGHHGNVGCEIDYYDIIQPTVIWWPHHAKAASDYLNPASKSKGFRYEVDQYFTNNIASVHYIFTSGIKSAGDQYFTTLVLKADGPDYDNIYDIFTKEKIAYSDISQDAYANVSSCMRK